MKKILTIICAFVGFMSFVPFADAASITPGPLTISYDGSGPVFSEIDLEPGEAISKMLSVRNDGEIAHSFAIATQNISGDLSGSIFIEPIYMGNKVFSKTISELSNLSNGSQRVVDSIASGATVSVELQARFDNNSTNDLQGKSISFDMVFGTEEAEPTGVSAATFGVRRLFAAAPTPSVTPTSSVTVTPLTTATPAEGEVRGESTQSSHKLNPLYLLLIPAGVVISAVLMPEFAFTAGMTVVAGAATYILGSESIGPMPTRDFIILLVIEVIFLGILCYFFFKHENRVSRRIRAHKHRLRLR